jgi:alpha-1,2-mannosyltransferase
VSGPVHRAATGLDTPLEPEHVIARFRWPLLLGIVALIGFAVRLVPVLRGGGLRGLGNYDDGVYFAAGTALAHGLLPYRDFLLLHPPGIVLALAPFGVLSRLTGDPSAFAAARLTWMALGALNTVLVARIVKPFGLIPAASSALVYALSYPAIYTESTTLLEAPEQTCVLLAMLLLISRDAPGRVLGAGPAVLAGALLGASATFKIWGTVAVVAVVGWYLVRRRWRGALGVLVGSGAAVTVVCLPFFVAAPATMWRMVVLDQLGRTVSTVPAATRLAGILGLGLHRPAVHSFSPLLVAVLLVVAGLLAVAWTEQTARLAVVLAVSLTALLLASPSWFLHYPGIAGGPLAIGLVVGATATARRARRVRPVLGLSVVVLLLSAVAASVWPLRGLSLGSPFPAATLSQGLRARGGCVTADDPATLIELDVLSRNLSQHCAFVADIGGYSYELAQQRGFWIHRHSDDQWQQIYLHQLEAGTIALPTRYAGNGSLSERTQASIRRWTALAQDGPFILRTVPPGQ